MALPDEDASVGWSFGFEFDGIQIKQIQELSGVKMEQDVIELKANTKDGKYVNKQLPGRPKIGEISITRGLTSDKTFQDWVKDAHQGNMPVSRKGGSVIVYDYQGAEIMRYKLTNCWPKVLEVGTLKAGDTSILTEKLTIAHEGCAPA
ncbi:MAG TPA: phage tail protein [Actinomycetota bacterium]|jgi:phage tail-like protein|nr:phage tail protein [Actinomycetota bacterium]